MISVRSNMQNPIKKWDLVSNDELQNELARFFRKRGLFYERRQREWNSRKTELKSLGIECGPAIKKLAQFIASYYWNRKDLGPAVAYGNIGRLFDDDPYTKIFETSPETVYQIFLLSQIVTESLKRMRNKKKFVDNHGNSIKFTLFSIFVKYLSSANVRWGRVELTKLLEDQAEEPLSLWDRITLDIVRHVDRIYKRAARRLKSEEDKDLGYNNFYKSQAYVGDVLKGRPSGEINRLTKKLIKSAKRRM